MQQEQDRTINNVIGGPYNFELKTGLMLSLDEWTIDAEQWAKKHFGSLQVLYNRLMRIEASDAECVDAVVRVAAFKLTADSARKVSEVKPSGISTEDWLQTQLTYRHLAVLCKATYTMIRDSMPIELLDELKKNPSLLAQMQGVQNPEPKIPNRAARRKPKRR